MTDTPDFAGMAQRLSDLADEVTAAAETLEDESAAHALRLKALTMAHYALELELQGRGERR